MFHYSAMMTLSVHRFYLQNSSPLFKQSSKVSLNSLYLFISELANMQHSTKQIIQRIGETDQLFLAGNSPELALERAELRLNLVIETHSKQEQLHFLQEAIVLLETARVEFEEMLMRVYIDLSLHLAKAYMVYFEITKETRFALITKQILKPLTQHENGDIFLFLAYASVVRDEMALTRHWLMKYSQTAEFDMELLGQHRSFKALHSEDWFKKLLKQKLH